MRRAWSACRRGALQSKIRSGELAAFEGMVAAEDLLRAYPQARLEDNSGLERLEAIKDSAFAQRMRERLLPSAEALVARLSELSIERAQVQAQLEHYRAIVEQLQAKLREPAASPAQLRDWLRQRVAGAAQGEPPLLAQESLLRIMSAHVQVKPSGREFFVDGNDSLLEAALRAGLSLDYGCSIGSCGKCKARILSGQVQRTRHSDYALTAAEKSAGVVLMCCNTALTDLVMEAREAHGAADMPLQTIDARVKSVSPLGDDVRLLHLQTPRSNRLRFLAGQSVVARAAGRRRCVAARGELPLRRPQPAVPCAAARRRRLRRARVRRPQGRGRGARRGTARRVRAERGIAPRRSSSSPANPGSRPSRA